MAPGRDAIREARAAYLRLIEPVGRATAALGEPEAADASTFSHSILRYAMASEQVATALEGKTWPTEVAQPIEELIDQLRAQAIPLRRAAQGSYVDDMQRRLEQVPSATAAARAREAFEQAGA